MFRVQALQLVLRVPTHRPLSSSFLGLPYRTVSTNHKKELLRGLWVGVSYILRGAGVGVFL